MGALTQLKPKEASGYTALYNKDKSKIEPAVYQHVSAYVSTWRQITGYYLNYVPNEYADQVTADQSYEILQNDESIFHALDLLSLDASGDFLEVRCRDKTLEFILNTGLSHINDFTHSRKSLAYGSTLFGLGLQKKVWDTFELEEFPGVTFEFPIELKEVDRRRLRIERPSNDFGRERQYWTIYSQKYDQYVKIKSRAEFPQYECCLEDFVWCYWEFEETNPYFRGVGQVLFRLAYIRSKIVPYWAQIMENWGQPIVIAMVNSMKGAFDAAGLGAGFSDASSRIDKLIDKWEMMKARNMFVADKNGDQVTVHEHGNQGTNMILEFLDYADGKIQNILLGADLVSGAGSGRGSYALGEMHEGKFGLKSKYLSKRISSAYKNYLVYDMIYRNRSVLTSLGIKIPSKQELSVSTVSEKKQLKEDLIEKTISTADVKKAVETL